MCGECLVSAPADDSSVDGGHVVVLRDEDGGGHECHAGLDLDVLGPPLVEHDLVHRSVVVDPLLRVGVGRQQDLLRRQSESGELLLDVVESGRHGGGERG